MQKYRKNGTIYILVILLLGITLGYAYLNTTLNINGTTNITSANWNIYWDNIQLGSNNVTDVTTPATISQGLTEVVFNVNFSEPGDTYEFTVDAVNDGSINAMISVVNSGVYATNGTTPKTLPDYLEYTVTYSDGVAIAQNHLLEAGDTETYKVRVHYKEDISANQLPSTNDNYVFKFSVTYVQATSSAVVVDHPRYVYVVNSYFYDRIYLNEDISPEAMPEFNVILYQTPSEALNAAIENVMNPEAPPFFYLKHRIVNNVVTESYVEFIITPEKAQANPGMVVGTYDIRGGIDEQDSAEKPIYEANKEVIKQAFGYTTDPSRCTETSYSFDCYGVATFLNGHVFADNGNGWSCNVYGPDYDGGSGCGW